MLANTDEMEAFCNRWKKDVFGFCLMFLGDGAAAEAVACEALVAFCREGSTILNNRTIPPRVIWLVLQAMQREPTGRSGARTRSSELEDAMQRLPREERAIVIMRNLLHMDWESVALAARASPAQVHEMWKRGILQLNSLLRPDFAVEAPLVHVNGSRHLR